MDVFDRRPRYYDQLIEDFCRKIDRQWVLDMLRDRHGLSLHAVQGVQPDVVRRRQAAYEAELAVLREKWALEDGINSNENSNEQKNS